MRHNFINSQSFSMQNYKKIPNVGITSGIFMASCGYIRADIIYSAP